MLAASSQPDKDREPAFENLKLFKKKIEKECRGPEGKLTGADGTCCLARPPRCSHPEGSSPRPPARLLAAAWWGGVRWAGQSGVRPGRKAVSPALRPPTQLLGSGPDTPAAAQLRRLILRSRLRSGGAAQVLGLRLPGGDRVTSEGPGCERAVGGGTGEPAGEAGPSSWASKGLCSQHSPQQRLPRPQTAACRAAQLVSASPHLLVANEEASESASLCLCRAAVLTGEHAVRTGPPPIRTRGHSGSSERVGHR